MPAVAVVTDSTPYLPRELVAAHGIEEVSLYVTDGDGQRRESDITDYVAFYDGLRAGTSLPTTSQPSIGDFLAVYEPLAQAGRDVVSVHLSGGVSGTVESARQAAAELAERHPGRRVEVVDSRLVAGAFGAVVLATAAAADGGRDVDGVAARAREASRETTIMFALDTLEFLRRSGRVGGAAAWVGGALKIKPILSLDDDTGTLEPVERVRTSGRAVQRLVDHLRDRHAAGAGAWVVQHIQAPRDAERLVARGREIFGTEPLLVSEIGPVIGAHAGPGLLGVGALPAALLRP
ncbi:MAG: DegV family protein [Solirubrobacteraceae bacterium]